MVNKRLKRAWSCPLGDYLLFAAVAAWSWTGTGTALPAPGSAVAGQGKTATDPAKRAVSKPKPAEPAASKRPSAPSKWGPVEAGHRDPFELPPPPKSGTPVGESGEEIGPLPAGKKGLVISQLTLEGIVRQETTNTMIAVVANPTNRAYFLRERDEVYNGVVSKITPDSVYFTENFRDAQGQMTSRQVVKRLGPVPGENR